MTIAIFLFKFIRFKQKFKRYNQHIQYSKDIISNKKCIEIIHKECSEFYLQIISFSKFEKYFAYFIVSYFIPNTKHNISISKFLSHMFFCRRSFDQDHDCVKFSRSFFNDIPFN